MEKFEIVALIFSMCFCFLIEQGSAYGYVGNNRVYSAWYETHFLVEKKGVFKLIYFKPKHFGRYTLFEVLSFFASFLFLIIFGLVAILLLAKIISSNAFIIVLFSLCAFSFLCLFVVMIINDICSHKDEKKRFYLELGERPEQKRLDLLEHLKTDKQNKLITKVLKLRQDLTMNSYFTIYNLRESYYARLKKAGKDVAKIEKVNKEYIEYFKNIEKLVVIKENKDGSLMFKK